METGIQIITKERQRQISQEGWTADHDATEHHSEELAAAAGCYALAGETRGTFRYEHILQLWPWDKKWWKPTPDDRVRELAKAGALIAAEIDRINGVDGDRKNNWTIEDIPQIVENHCNGLLEDRSIEMLTKNILCAVIPNQTRIKQ